MRTMNTMDDTYHDYQEYGETRAMVTIATKPPNMNLQACGQGVWDLVLTLSPDVLNPPL